MLPAWIRSRQVFLGIFIATALMMGFGYWLQYAEGLEPCPLCMTQRIFITLAGLTGLAAALHGPGRAGIRVYGTRVARWCVVGGGFSIRHLWLQSLPPERVPACGPGLDYMLEAFPFTEVLQTVLSGSGECAQVDWHFLGLAMPGWVLLCVLVLGLAGVWNNLRRA